MGLYRQLNNIESGFATVAEFPQFKNTPIIIGESDPDGCAACTGMQYGYRNTSLYAVYTVEALARTFEIAADHQINFQGALTWAFEFEDDPMFAGHRTLATNGIDMPILNIFRMFSHLQGTRLRVDSSATLPLQSIEKSSVHAAPDVQALATLSDHQLAVILWNYHDDDVPGPSADVDLSVNHLPPQKAAALTEYRIDQFHSNAFTAWLNMGSPAHPTPDQLAQLKLAGQLTKLRFDPSVDLTDGSFNTHTSLPRQGISLLILTFQ
jgi:xylan 1,4-beta-xylosidase